MSVCRRLRFAPAALLLLGAFAAAGCGSSPAGVEGSVTLDGKPVDGGIIAFVPVADNRAAGNVRMVHTAIENGHYALKAGKGPRPGKYRVDISWKKKTGRQIPSNDPPNKIDEVIQVIPRKYNLDSQITVDIKGGANQFDYAINSEKGSKPGRATNASNSLRD